MTKQPVSIVVVDEGGEVANRNEDLEWLYRPDGQSDGTKMFRPDPPQPQPSRQNSYSQVPGWEQLSPAQSRGQADQPNPISPEPAQPSQQPRWRRKRRRPVLRLLGFLFFVWVLFLVGTPIYAWSIGNTIDTTLPGDRPAAQPGTTVLLIGSDSRDDLTEEQQGVLGTGNTEGRRTDTMLLLHTPTQGAPVLLSLPRDSYVAIPGHGRNKLNAAYAFGGPTLLLQTIETNTGIHIDGYLEVGFLGIVDTVDALGGIEVCPSFDIDDQDSHLTLKAGCQSVDGLTALGYVRMRKQDPQGDLGRVERQREVIAAIAKKAASPMTVLNPILYWKLNMAVAGTLKRGETTGPAEMIQVANGMLSTVTGSGLSLTVPISNADASTSAGSSVIWDETASAEVFAAIAAGDTTPLKTS